MREAELDFGGSGTIRAVILLNRVMAIVVAATLFAMMGLVSVDVVCRYLFSAPIKGSFEIIQFMLAIIIFAALPLLTRDNGHVTVSLFDGYFSRRMARFQRLFVSAISAVALALIAWRMWGQGLALADGRQVTGFLEWPIAPIAYAMSGLSAVSLAVVVYLIWMELLGRELPSAAPPSGD